MVRGQLERLEFATIAGGDHELGWHYTGQLPADVRAALDDFLPFDEFLSRFTPHRNVELSPFSIATTAVGLGDVVEPAALADVGSIAAACDVIDAALEARDMRVPSVDEVEAACGGALFAWGMSVPDGVPFRDQTTWQRHREPNEHGLSLNSDPYTVEVARAAFKLGDGGSAICGDYPWPVAWFALAPSWQLVDEDVDECLAEYLESATVRPVRIATR